MTATKIQYGPFTKKIRAKFFLRKETEGLNLRDVGRAVGCSHTTFNDVLEGHIPSEDVIWNIAKFFGLNAPEMIRLARMAKAPTEEVRDIYEAFHYYPRPKNASAVNGHEAMQSQRPMVNGLVRVPVFDSGAGQPSHFSDGGYPVGEAADYVFLPTGDVDENTFCVTVHGDSMADTFWPGDKVLVVPSASLASGDICFASWPDEFGQRLVKRFRQAGQTIILESDNKAYDPIILNPDTDTGVRIYRVTQLIRKL